MGGGLSKAVPQSHSTHNHAHPSKHKLIRVSAAQPQPPHISSEHATNNSPHNTRRRSSVAPRRLSMFDVTDDKLVELAETQFNLLDPQRTGYLLKPDLELLTSYLLFIYKPFNRELKPTEVETIRKQIIHIIDSSLEPKLDFFEFVNIFTEASNRVALLAMSAEKFRSLDTDNSGFLEREELLEVANWILHSYEKIGFAEHEQKLIIDRLIMRVDSDGDGALDLKEFTHLFEHATNKIVLMNKARSMFQEIDTNNSGFIERDELGVLADRLLALQRYDERSAGSEPFTARERSQMIERVLRMADGLGEGRIDLYSFSQIYDSLSEQMGMCARARSKFREFDLNEDGFLEGDELPRLLDWVLKALGEVSAADNSNERTVKTIKAAIDSNRALEFKAFITIFTNLTNRLQTMKKGKAKFDELDVDKSGYLEASEIQVMMDWMMIFYSGSEEPLPAEELEVMKRDMMGLVDVDNDGRISLAEFVVVFNQVEQKREEIRRRKSL